MKSARTKITILSYVALGISSIVILLAIGNIIVRSLPRDLADIKRYKLAQTYDFTLSQFAILHHAIKQYAIDHASLPPFDNYYGPFPHGILTTPVSYLHSAYQNKMALGVGSETLLPIDPFGPAIRSAPGFIKHRSFIKRKGSDFMYAIYSNETYTIISRGPDGVFQFDPAAISALKSDDKRTSYILSISIPRGEPLAESTKGDFVSWGSLKGIMDWKIRNNK